MNVPHERVLAKMEQEIAAARSASPGDIERHVYAIKSMCELIIGSREKDYAPRSVSVQPVVTPSPQPAIQQTERIVTDDGSNGDSIFDF
ncbi:hypothetical protein BTO30_02025 [Domibacillus antri]|uniref:YwdI family protein n=1 Tax=Domibacillus antri TaxID=1714264 RepID=A0A1Q8QA39_9BACI|nr:YwdI family protein [Domibacillus antri]OLN24209.1 hypothetical protein BTO30_02025 [Domibacillus antri]